MQLVLILTGQGEQPVDGVATFFGRLKAAVIKQVRCPIVRMQQLNLKAQVENGSLDQFFLEHLWFLHNVMSAFADLNTVAPEPTAQPEITTYQGRLPLLNKLKQLAASSVVLQVCPDVTEREVFQCGPDTMMNSVVAELEGLGVSSAHIHQESFNF